MTKRWLSVVLFLGTAASTSALANVQMNQSGLNCVVQPVDSAKVALIYGIGDGSSSPINPILCPIDWQTSGQGNVQLGGHTIGGANETDVYYVDGSTTDAVFCAVNGIDSAQTEIFGSGMGSCSTAGGCSTFVDSFTSRSGGTYLAMVQPSADYEWNYYLSCYLPGVQSGFISSIQGYTTVYDDTP